MPPRPDTAASDLTAARAGARAQTLRDYLSLTKPEISFLVGVSTLCGLLVAPGHPDPGVAAAALLGTLLTAAGACALNHVLEFELDRRMRRTAHRPVASGRLSVAEARWFGLALVAAGMGLLCPLTNAATAILAGATVILYLFVYTPLKQRTAWNTLVGAIPGALPALGGAVAVSGNPGPGGWLVFALLAAWQIPHFMALAWMYRKDYRRGGFRMVTAGDPTGRRTASWALLGTMAAAGCGIAVGVVGPAGPVLVGTAIIAGLHLLWATARFFGGPSAASARRLLKASVVYIPVFALGLVVDWLLYAGPVA